jgi:hypothetical protein
MSDEPSPAKLPDHYQAKPPKLPPSIGKMAIDAGNQFWISDTAVRIAATTGVWLDPKAPVSAVQDSKTPIKVLRTFKGYSVDLTHASMESKKGWPTSKTDSFADQGFIWAWLIL